jgi:hypothetical protein
MIVLLVAVTLAAAVAAFLWFTRAVDDYARAPRPERPRVLFRRIAGPPSPPPAAPWSYPGPNRVNDPARRERDTGRQEPCPRCGGEAIEQVSPALCRCSACGQHWVPRTVPRGSSQ